MSALKSGSSRSAMAFPDEGGSQMWLWLKKPGRCQSPSDPARQANLAAESPVDPCVTGMLITADRRRGRRKAAGLGVSGLSIESPEP